MSAINLTAREQELLCAVIEVMKANIDWPEVAKIANFNTPKQARDKWPAVRKKLVETNSKDGGCGDDGAAATPAPKAKKTPTSHKRKNGGDGGDDEEATPSKSAKKQRGKKADTPVVSAEDKADAAEDKVKAESGDEDDVDLLWATS